MSHDDYEFPADLPDGPETHGHSLRWAASVMAIATVLLALTNAQSPTNWANNLPPSATVARLVTLTEGWQAFTDRAALGAPRAALHRAWKAMEQARWPGQKSDQR